jgi:calcium-dependent protein kinase
LSRKYDEKCDVWSCGVILYILLCGYPPFNGNSGEQIIARVKKGKYVLSGKGWENISSDAKNLIKKMLEISPSKRISAEAALNDKWIQTMCKKESFEASQVMTTLNSLQSFKVSFDLFLYLGSNSSSAVCDGLYS